MNSPNISSRAVRAVFATAMGFTVLLSASSLQAVTRQGNPFTPPGADFQIFAEQGVDSSHPLGLTGVSPQVNTDFEFTPSIGVSYDKGGGQLKDFGLGLFQDSSHNTLSTGLHILYNQPVDAYSVSLTVEDFDIKPGEYFKPNKVSPAMFILGANNAVIANLTPAQIYPYLMAHTSDPKDDIWDINFSQLLGGNNIANGSISGFVLYANQTNGERASSDPYLLLSVGNGNPPEIPEAGNFVAGLVAILFAVIFQLRKRANRKVTA